MGQFIKVGIPLLINNLGDVMKNLYSVSDYQTIENADDRKDKRNQLARTMATDAKKFNNFVKASVQFFYGESDNHINVINDLLRMATVARGMNAGRLASYLKKIVPHKLEESTKHGEAPKFGKKLDKKDYPNQDEVIAFLMDNPYWYQHGKVDKASSFDEVAYLKTVISKLKTNKVDLAKFAGEILAAKVA